ncbi:MAG: winged helix-turn-helix domain-containing protein, partial [Gammaproteobacteria bacterium]|nr:winged helix-turn-helix domain-containing protein [Gammaproteobacteria bacterium]
MPLSYHFGEFELDPADRQLRSGGKAVPLERRSMDLLVLLVERHGRMVPREEIIAALWPPNVIIDFDSGLNTLVRKVRKALGDSTDEPRFIETVPGRGYRFIAPVTEPASIASPSTAPMLSRRKRSLLPALLAVTLVVAIGAAAVWRLVDEEPVQTRIAILPFENLTGDESLGYLATGIAEETNLSLARIDLPNLSVIGVVSAMAIAGTGRPLAAVGRELGVDYLVMSSLRLDGTRLRVTSRLLRIADGEQVWSASFDRELTNLLGLQRELSVAIAEQIRQRLSPAVAEAIDRRQTQNPEAYALYLKGRSEWTRFRPDSVPRALGFYRQAVEKDPGYGLAWAGIAHALVTSVATIEASRESLREPSEDALQRALEYAPGLSETQLALASYYGFLNRDLVNAEAAARQAIALDPNSAMAHMFLGLTLVQQDNYVEARSMLRRARELDPLFPLMFANSANAAIQAGEPQEAIEYATQAVAIDPEFWVGYLHLGTARMETGDDEGALQAFAEAEKLTDGTSARVASSRAFLLARTGHTDEARDILAELIERPGPRNVRAYHIAVVHAGLGEDDLALEWLERGIASGEVFCIDLERDRFFRHLGGYMRFEALAKRCRDIEVYREIG